ncbi:MAG: hypothetical protein Q8M15_14660 [Bacteroidota bacterium]|nr:hypothetical protein [Bacteroidota bacterium]
METKIFDMLNSIFIDEILEDKSKLKRVSQSIVEIVRDDLEDGTKNIVDKQLLNNDILALGKLFCGTKQLRENNPANIFQRYLTDKNEEESAYLTFLGVSTKVQIESNLRNIKIGIQIGNSHPFEFKSITMKLEFMRFIGQQMSIIIPPNYVKIKKSDAPIHGNNNHFEAQKIVNKPETINALVNRFILNSIRIQIIGLKPKRKIYDEDFEKFVKSMHRIILKEVLNDKYKIVARKKWHEYFSEIFLGEFPITLT